MIRHYLYVAKHEPAEEGDDEESVFYGLSDDECSNVIDTLYEVGFDIDPEDGKVQAVHLNNEQVFSTKTARLNVIVAAHKVMENMTPKNRLDYIRSFGICLRCGEEINGTCYCLNDE